MATIVDALDDDGFLRMDLQELKALSGLEPPPDDDEMAIALKLVQSLEPAGVAARDLRECLLLQLREDDDPARLQSMSWRSGSSTSNLDRLAMRDIPGLARALGVAQHAVSQAGELHPAPATASGLEIRCCEYSIRGARRDRAQDSGEWTVRSIRRSCQKCD